MPENGLNRRGAKIVLVSHADGAGVREDIGARRRRKGW
jgi:hypothetical protein